MSRLTLRLPETLHHQLIYLAESEGVSLNQYIVYALTHQSALSHTAHPIPVEEISQQKQAFQALQQKLGQASVTQIKSALAARQVVQPEQELSSEMVDQIQQRIHDVSKA